MNELVKNFIINPMIIDIIIINININLIIIMNIIINPIIMNIMVIIINWIIKIDYYYNLVLGYPKYSSIY